jgi:hypothetical protein
MKKLLLIIIFSVAFSINAQVGIGTSSPQKDLHVSGTTSTIRIEKLNSVNSATFNKGGTSITPVFVDRDGELTLSPPGFNGSNQGTLAPINFLYNVGNFVADNSGKGVVLNNGTGVTSASSLITTVPFPSTALTQTVFVEVKYGMTVVLSSTDINSSNSVFSDESARTFNVYFCIDINNDGLDASELSKKYGYCGLSYSSGNQGILGYPYMNGFGLAEVPAGTHSLHFFAETNDGTSKYTSAGFGGAQDYLKIRIFN